MEVAFDNIRQAEGITDDILPLKEKLENLKGRKTSNSCEIDSFDFPNALWFQYQYHICRI